MVLVLAACRGGDDGKPDDDPVDTQDPTGGDGVQIQSITAETNTISQATVSVTLSESASAAAACVRRDDPTEVHLLEAEGTAIDFRFSGLLSATDYDCSVAAITPASPAKDVSFTTGAPPFEHATATATRHETLEMTGAYTVMNIKPTCFDDSKNYLAVLDAEGNNRWRYDLPNNMNIGIEVVPDGYNRFLWGGGRDPLGAPTVVDVLDGPMWKLAFPGSDDVIFHHDVHRIDDGRILSVEENDDPGWDAFQLRLSDPETGETSWFWDVADAVEDGFLRPGSEDIPDPHHLNWADVVETDDGLVAYGSLCFEFQTIAIDVATSEPLWKFGYGGDFTLVDAEGNALREQEDYPQCQHGLQMDGTHMLIYDNGFNREVTRAVEYEFDYDQMTVHKTWEWFDEGFFERYHGGVDWLNEDHSRVLVAEGNNDCGEVSDRHSQIVELDRSQGDAEVHRLVLDELGHFLYRADRVDGCDVFANTRYCPALATRLDELRDALEL